MIPPVRRVPVLTNCCIIFTLGVVTIIILTRGARPHIMSTVSISEISLIVTRIIVHVAAAIFAGVAAISAVAIALTVWIAIVAIKFSRIIMPLIGPSAVVTIIITCGRLIIPMPILLFRLVSFRWSSVVAGAIEHASEVVWMIVTIEVFPKFRAL